MKKVFFSLAAMLMINIAANATECTMRGPDVTVTVSCTCTSAQCDAKLIKAYEAAIE